MSALPCSSSSFSPRKYEYDIFLSFSGTDTRYGFTGHLDKALSDGGIKTFRDDKSLKIGKIFPPELLRAIGESRGSIVVFSQRYAFSRWCLDELVEIMKQRKEWGHEVYPIFYYIEPSDLKYQLKAVKEAFDKHENGKRYTKEKMQSWRHALFEVAELHGRTLRVYKYESDVIVQIVQDILSARLAETIINIKPQIEKLEAEFLQIRAMIDGAEKILFRGQNDQIYKEGLTELKDLAYELDDIVDEFETHSKMVMEPKFMISDSCNTEFNKGILLKINEVNPRLKELEPQKNRLQQQLIRMTGCDESKRMEPRLPETSSVEMTAHVYGRDQVKKAIVHSLLEKDDEANFVIPIVGMGGIGKTTLAKLVYNDAHVEHHFDLLAWVCVSNDFDVTGITKQMLESITSQTCNDNALNILQLKLKKELSKKRFLIVLDNVWNEDPHKWKILQSPFLRRTPGSKIIVTTRNHNVSSIMGASHAHSLEVLSHDDALSIFAQHASVPRDFEGCPPDLKKVAKKIVRKCDGLPLAAEILGGLLSTVHIDDWKDVLESGIWKLPESQCDIIPALRVSYHYLPPHLKQCFAYCSIFPKDYIFEEEEIILLWRAEGFLKDARGKQCIDNLLSRSLLQKRKIAKPGFVMHDLVHDLAQLVAGEICLRKDGDYKKILKHTRYLSTDREYFDIYELKGIREAKHLRTILPLRFSLLYWLLEMYPFDCPRLRPSLEYYNVLGDLRCLRVLSFKRYWGIEVLPDIFGDLKHLRYLDFSHTEMNTEMIRSLPESISTLYNLETLLLVECRRLKKLPAMTENLVNLHHLNLTNAYMLEGMPSNFGALTNLEFLSNFVVGKDKRSQIRELRDLSNLKGTLNISGIQNVVDPEDALKAKIADKSGLDELVLDWHSRSQIRNRKSEKKTHRNVLVLLEPCKQLKKLGILNYRGSELAKWVGNSSLTNLESLSLFNCPNYPFRSLEILEFGDMPNWKIWDFSKVDEEARKFPKFRELCIRECPKLLLLVSLPKQLYDLEELEIERCGNLVISIPSLPRLSQLQIESCGEVVCEGFEDHSSTMLRELELRRCENLISLSKNNLLLNVNKLSISRCQNLKFLWEGDSSNACVIEEIDISNCDSLVSLSSKCELPASVKKLTIWFCRNLVSIAPEIQHNSSLKYIMIEECPNLENLPQGLNKLSHQQKIRISGCPKFVSFPEGSLPTSLKSVLIDEVPTPLDSLTSLHEGIAHPVPEPQISSSKTFFAFWVIFLGFLLLKLNHSSYSRHIESSIHLEKMSYNPLTHPYADSVFFPMKWLNSLCKFKKLWLLTTEVKGRLAATQGFNTDQKSVIGSREDNACCCQLEDIRKTCSV
ncbi:hypothetical protein CCACVL1_17289 [Corchorus capsularis]|uniref:TIR domain-containing protein n=1 Tax=Corchorus capsularis TaxID=210143 RepID=A0A1R3HSM4_COCAP|nr:hypothetical protein CCACVL1_17289 [Corchorus capsularis]